MSSNKSGSRRGTRSSSQEYWDDDSYEYDDRSGRRGSSTAHKGNASHGNSGSRSGHGGTASKANRGSQGSSSNKRPSGNTGSKKSTASKKRRRKGQPNYNIILVLAAAIIVVAVILALRAVTGSLGATDYTSSTIEFLASGKIRVTTIESFDQDYYDEDELRSTIKEAISEYGSGVEQEYLDVSDGTAQLVMLYDSAEDYVSFNGTDLFVGTVAEAEEAGYDFQSIMSAVSQEDTSKILTEATLEQLLENEVIILFEQADVVTDADMLYATPNLGVTDSTHATAIDTISDDTPAIVILVDD